MKTLTKLTTAAALSVGIVGLPVAAHAATPSTSVAASSAASSGSLTYEQLNASQLRISSADHEFAVQGDVMLAVNVKTGVVEDLPSTTTD